jgi:hypothetical protein
VALAKALENNSTISNMSLGHINIGAEGGTAILKALKLDFNQSLPLGLEQ